MPVGTSGYSYAAWKGLFYPKTLAADAMLGYYSKRFSAVEINSTFYRLPQADVLKTWASQVPKKFLFAFKAPGAITHRTWTDKTPGLVRQFVKVTAVLEERLGPLLFQFPPYLKKNPLLLTNLFAVLPKTRRIALEFRHASWFDRETFDTLKGHNAPLVYNDADVADRPFEKTSDWGYLRLRRTDYSDRDLKTLIKTCQDQAWRDEYIFFKHEERATGPALAARWIKLAGD